MAKHDVPLDIALLLNEWLEALFYGIFVCLFCGSLYVNLYFRRVQDIHSKIMFIVSITMFIIATIHVALNCFRIVDAYVLHRTDALGPVGRISKISTWDHTMKDILYATQEMLGDLAAIYRTYYMWGRNWKIVLFPAALLVVSIISGYTTCGLYHSTGSASSIFNPTLFRWITTFYAVSFVQSGITTGLMAYRIWKAERRARAYRTDTSRSLKPILWILVESASLQFIVEAILLALYAADYNAQYLLLEPVTPIVGITFTAITIRIAMHQAKTIEQSRDASSFRAEAPRPTVTIGSMPLRRITAINVNITKDIETDDVLEGDERKTRRGDVLGAQP